MREKLTLYREAYISVDMLEKLLAKFAPSYTTSDLCDKWLITPIKRGRYYINNLSLDIKNPYIIGALYMEGEIYSFGGMVVYNRYGLTEQIAEWYTIYNTKISWQRVIWGAKFIFRRQRDSFFYGITESVLGWQTYRLLTRERALIELLKEWKTYNELPKNIDRDILINLSKQYSSRKIQSQVSLLCS